MRTKVIKFKNIKDLDGILITKHFFFFFLFYSIIIKLKDINLINLLYNIG